ncbi:MAG TPA: DoxX family protein, partial [Chloroflexia bacterium]|nr:DoxX family protein [Chloroflexia bacterium]
MFTAYVVVTLMAIAANTVAATADFMRYKFVLITAAKAGVPESWLSMLGTLKAAGALGLLVGLILFFVGAIITHLRVRDYSVGPAAAFLLLAVAALVLGVVS